VKPLWIAIASIAASVVAAGTASSVALADPEPRCQQGLDFAARGDLPRASLYLESCNTDSLDEEAAAKVRKTKADVAHKLDASKLSAMSIVTTPGGLVAETDAMPGERFTTPATIWTKGGDYTINIAADAATLDAGKGLTTSTSLDPFSRRTVILNVPIQAPPKDGKVDFEDDPSEQAAHEGPPPAVKHDTMLPKKYRKPGAPSGPQLDDPFALSQDGSYDWHLGARAGGGMYVHDASNTGAALSVSALAWRSLGGPVALATRLGWSHRDVDALGLYAGVALRLAGTSSFVL
jgi:hypothetical protein